jgi:F-type H+-transporting ATPase subunit delta
MRKAPLTYARELHVALGSAAAADRPAIVRNFLAGLARGRKSSLRPRIAEAFKWVALAAEGRRPGRLITASALDEATRREAQAIWKNVMFEERTDPSLLGGAVVDIEDTRIDGSVRTRLENLKRALIQPQ